MNSLKSRFNFLAILSLFQVLNSQTNNLKVTYTIIYKPINFDSIYNSNEKKVNNTDYLSMIKANFKRLEDSAKELHKLKFTLEFNEKESIFYKEQALSIDEKKMANIYSFLGIRDHKYYNTNNQVIHSLNAYGSDFLVELPKIEWQITNEQKIIGKFNCYKATAIIKRENSKGRFNQHILAWFTPEIPFNFGPKEYSGLPGLIIELIPGENIGYRLIAIKKENYKRIEMPILGKKMSFEEFNEIGKKMFENRKNN